MQKVTSIVSRKTDHVSLVQGHDYEVIGIDDTCFRIVDESGEPALHPKSFFMDCDIVPPDNWKYQDFGEGEYAYSPAELATIGFFEDYSDGQVTAVQRFRSYLENRKRLDRE